MKRTTTLLTAALLSTCFSATAMADVCGAAMVTLVELTSNPRLFQETVKVNYYDAVHGNTFLVVDASGNETQDQIAEKITNATTYQNSKGIYNGDYVLREAMLETQAAIILSNATGNLSGITDPVTSILAAQCVANAKTGNVTYNTQDVRCINRPLHYCYQ
jgi:hypothetical protein